MLEGSIVHKIMVLQAKLNTFQTMLTFGGIERRSPLGRVKSLLSSSTLFKFSTHSGSTSPSKIIQ